MAPVSTLKVEAVDKAEAALGDKFNVKVPESGEFEFIWLDDDGKTYSAKKKITVS